MAPYIQMAVATYVESLVRLGGGSPLDFSADSNPSPSLPQESASTVFRDGEKKETANMIFPTYARTFALPVVVLLAGEFEVPEIT